MDSDISRIKTHIYVKRSVEAVELYKEAFALEDKGERILDNDGNIWHCVLMRNGEEYLSVSEDKYLPDELIKDCGIENIVIASAAKQSSVPLSLRAQRSNPASPVIASAAKQSRSPLSLRAQRSNPENRAITGLPRR